MMIAHMASLPGDLVPSLGASGWPWDAANRTTDVDLFERVAVSGTADPVQPTAVARDPAALQPDDDEAVQQMFAAFGKLYQSAAKINQVCNDAKFKLAYHD